MRDGRHPGGSETEDYETRTAQCKKRHEKQAHDDHQESL